MIDVFLCALRSLLMDQIKVAESRLFMCTEFEQYVLSSEFVGSRHSIIASIKNVAGPILRELGFAELEQTDIRSGTLFGIKARFNSGNSPHKIKIQAEGVRCRLDLINRRSDWA